MEAHTLIETEKHT
jgi:hypothetical protein